MGVGHFGGHVQGEGLAHVDVPVRDQDRAAPRALGVHDIHEALLQQRVQHRVQLLPHVLHHKRQAVLQRVLQVRLERLLVQPRRAQPLLFVLDPILGLALGVHEEAVPRGLGHDDGVLGDSGGT